MVKNYQEPIRIASLDLKVKKYQLGRLGVYMRLEVASGMVQTTHPAIVAPLQWP